MALLGACASAQAKPKFHASEVTGISGNLIQCDLDGDGLKDLVQPGHLKLSVHYQNSKGVFTKEPQQTKDWDGRPSLIWAAKLGKASETLLFMTSDGVDELSFPDRTNPAVLLPIINQQTIVPDDALRTSAKHLSLSARTAEKWPLLLVPSPGGLQIWQHRDKWIQVQTIGSAIDARQMPTASGFTTSLAFDFSISDVNGDKREDLIIRRSHARGVKQFSLYLQQTNGLFPTEPSLTHLDNTDLRSWLCWADLNRDGKVDLLKSVGVNERSFVPGIPSAKVVVRTYIADSTGKIPSEPKQLFRKNDFNFTLPVVDVDGDGSLDLVLFFRHMDNRDDVAKLVTTKQLDYTLRFYFNRGAAGFPKEADCGRDVAFHLNRNELFAWVGNEDYYDYIRLAGDFSGDGKTDLLVREHDDRIAVYFFVSRDKGFSAKPDLQFSCPEQVDEWQANDLNDDGVSDLVVKLRKENGYRIFVSEK